MITSLKMKRLGISFGVKSLYICGQKDWLSSPHDVMARSCAKDNDRLLENQLVAMMKRNVCHQLLCCICLAGLFTLLACSGERKVIVPSADFAPYVYAYTGGVISQQGTIRVELAQEMPAVELNVPLAENPFRFSPNIEGEARWVDNRTLEFVPAQGELRPGELYEASFALSRFVSVGKELENFPFSFRVRERNFSLRLDPIAIQAAAPDVANLSGELRFSDVVDQAEVERMLTLKGTDVDAKDFRLESLEGGTLYRFTYAKLLRKAADYTLHFEAQGKAVGIKTTRVAEVVIPAKGSFRLLGAQRIDHPEPGVEVVFSDPLSTTQDLKGLIELSTSGVSVLQVKDNRILVFIEERGGQSMELKVHEGVTSHEGKPLGQSHRMNFAERYLKPQVELTASAAILPDSKNLILPFRAVGLKAVDLSIVRIFEHNILSFMQRNTLAGDSELNRSGRLVYKKTLWLNTDGTKDLGRWEDYNIDLAGLIKQEPGAIYRVYLSFVQDYAFYPCGGSSPSRNDAVGKTDGEGRVLVSTATLTEDDLKAWDAVSGYFSYTVGTPYDWASYDWNERENPCHPTYYMESSRVATCNVLASNLGVIAKRNARGKLWVAVTDILSTQPVKGAQVQVYNYQLQPLGRGTTDAEGWVEIDVKGVPFVLVAEKEGQKTYLRVVDGEEQSMSRFDVGGKETEKGLKGYIYGERGVWRPGDTLYIGFMLEDREQRIPAQHPVVLEVYDAQGKFAGRQVSTGSKGRLYTFRVPTAENAPTGFWNAYVKVGGAAFHKSLRVETIKPNRLKIGLNLDGGSTQLRPGKKPVGISASWLTGAASPGLKTKVELSLSKVSTQFKGYEGYEFNNPVSSFSSTRNEVFVGSLDAAGRVSFVVDLPKASDAPGMLNATLSTRVLEPGGDASVHLQTLPFSPFESYVGIRLEEGKDGYLETDVNHLFPIVVLDGRGRLVDGADLEYSIYRMDWDWWWDNGSESLGVYMNSSSAVPLKRGELRTRGGKAEIGFKVNYPDWGRYFIYVKNRDSGHATGGTVLVDWPSSRGRAGRTNPDAVKMLTFSLDKKNYRPGERAVAYIPSAAGGRALVTIENGSTVLKRDWVELKEGSDATYTFEVTPEMCPNAYLHISLLQPHAQTVNDLPIRMYGVVPVSVVNEESRLHPQIALPEVLRPEENFSVVVSERKGRAMTYTLAIVDEGLLDLTNFKTPDPWQHFNAKEALGIRTWDMFDYVPGARAGQYGFLFSTGGDTELKQAEAKAIRFKPVVKFLGPFTLDKGKKQTHNLKLPLYVGSVRVMVVAQGESAHGAAEKAVPVRTPLMLLSSLPRVLSTNEEITVTSNVFAMESQVKNVTVTMQTKGGGVAIDGAPTATVSFAKPGDDRVFFKLRTGNETGKAVIRLVAKGGGREVKEEFEIEVRNPNPVVTLCESLWLKGGEKGELAYDIREASAQNRVSLEVSRIPSVDFARRFDFLHRYTHDCTEQITSKALPALFASDLKTLDKQEQEQMKTNVQTGMERLYSRQLINGGFAYWPGMQQADEWVSSYAGMFLTLAKEKGYAVRFDVVERWVRYQRVAAQNWQYPSATEPLWRKEQACLQQAFRLYTLALAGASEIGAMNRLKEQRSLPLQARWRLAAAYTLAGKNKVAEELIFKLPTEGSTYAGVNAVYGSPLRDEALILETLVLMKRYGDALRLADGVARRLSQETLFETQSTAFALVAMGRLAGEQKGAMDFTWTLNDRNQEPVKTAKALFETRLPAQTGGRLAFHNRGEGSLHVNLVVQTCLDTDTLPAMNRGLQLEVKYLDALGNFIDPSTLKQGSDFSLWVKVTNTDATTGYTHLALTQLLPSGWEVYNERLMGASTQGTYTYRDIRDDRVLTYFGLGSGEFKVFTLRLQASYLGDYVLPAIQCESMYDTHILARTRAARTRVIR